MKEIIWDDELSVGIEIIDDQHRQIVGVINQLQEVIERDEALEVIDSVISFMSGYASTHFLTEEKFFIATDYPEYEQHKEMHDIFINKVAEFKETCASGKSKEFVLEVSSFLWDWLSQHIKVEDHKYARHLKEHGIK
jgi:hemerythrin